MSRWEEGPSLTFLMLLLQNNLDSGAARSHGSEVARDETQRETEAGRCWSAGDSPLSLLQVRILSLQPAGRVSEWDVPQQEERRGREGGREENRERKGEGKGKG